MIKLSASSMGTYDKCPKKYYYQYIAKPDVVIPEWSHLEFGTVAHRALELFHESLLKEVIHPDLWKDIMRDSFKEALIESEKRNKVNLIKELLPDLHKVLQKYLNVMRVEGLPPVLHNELEFKFKIEEFTVRGFIDRIDKYDNGVYHVVDYKTSKNGDYLTDFQLALYALALQTIYTDINEISGSYVLLKKGSTLKTWQFTDKSLEDTRNEVIRIGQNIDTDKLWEKKPSALCNWCDFRLICQDSWTQD